MATSPSMDSITNMLQSLQDCGETEMMHQLYGDWNELLRRGEINISMELRGKFDSWFLKCYHYFEDEGIKLQEENMYMFQQQNEPKLFDDLLEELRVTIAGEELPLNKWKFEHELHQLEAMSYDDWLKRAYLCVKEERKLMDSYNKVRADTLYKASRKQCETKYEEVAQKKKEIQEKLVSLEALIQKYSQTSQSHEELVSVMQGTLDLMQGLQERASSTSGNLNGLQNRNQYQETRVRQSQAELDQQFGMIRQSGQEVYKMFESLFKEVTVLLEVLFKELKHWQHQLTLDYVELKADVDLNRFAPWCAKTGQLLVEILDTEIPRLQHAIQSVSEAGSATRDCSQLLDFCEQLTSYYKNILNCFLQRTFVVTDQEGWCVKKKDKIQIPKVTVRVLALDSLEILRGAVVKAYFVLEDNIKDDWFFEQDNCQQLNVNQITGNHKIKNDKEKFVPIKKKQFYEGKFCNIILPGFDRGQRSKLVHEEKYRLLFHTCVNNHEVWTLSLPMVVTTGANQNCQCLASIMWQCFSTDVFAVPIETKNELPWSTVADMLNTKMEKLSRRKLSEENLEHLKHRIPDLIKSEDNDPLVSLTQFCVDKLDKEGSNPEDEKCQFSFWKWFLAAYNLIEKYLRDYWKNGWIEGFVSKSLAEKKLKESQRCRSAMYLLRFSDSYITDSQGLKSVFGFVTAAVLMIKKVKDNQKAKTVHHLDVAGHNKLKDKSLANIILGTEDTQHKKFYQYLYPDLLQSEKLFSPFSSSDPIVPGYQGVRDAYIVDLEQALQKLELTGKRMSSSSSSGSEDHDEYPDMKSPSLAGLKRIKSDSTDSKPSCQQTANTPPSFDSNSNSSSSSMSQNNSMKTSSNFPILSNLLNKPKKQESSSVVLQQQTVSGYPGTMETVIDAGQQASIPTMVNEMCTVDTQAIQNIQNPSNNPLTAFVSQQASSQVTMATDLNSAFMQEDNQQIWSQNSFVDMLQTDTTISQQPFSFTQNPNETGSMQQCIAVSAAESQFAVSMANTTGNQQLYGFTQNPNEAGAMHQDMANLTTGNQPVVTMADTTGSQQTSFYGNTGLSQSGGENNDPSFTELPKDISEEYIVNFVIQCIFPKMTQDQKEKLLATLQEPTSPQTDQPVQEGEVTPEDMVTSSSSGPLPFSQSQLKDGLESDSGQLAESLTLFDTVPLEDHQQF